MTQYPDFLPAHRAGSSGLALPRLSLGLWQNFGQDRSYESQRSIILEAFEQGVWHFDNANRYGPPHGWAESVLGQVISSDLAAHRSSLVIATKAGNPIAPGPYGRGGSRKHVLEALDASLRRLRLDHVDVFYSHSPDPDVPFEETAAALADAVQAGMALYIGISNYDAAGTREAAALLREAGVPLVVHQHRYSLLERSVEDDLHPVLDELGIGGVVYSPLAQGLLTDRYLDGVPSSARASRSPFLDSGAITEDYLDRARKLNAVAAERGVTLAQLALAWAVRTDTVTTAVVGASSPEQLRSNLKAIESDVLDEPTAQALEQIVAGSQSG